MMLMGKVTYSFMNVDPDLWAWAWEGAEEMDRGWPSKSLCRRAGLRPLPRHIEDGSVYSFCMIHDRSPNKDRWRKHHLWRGGPTLWQVLQEGGRPVAATSSTLDRLHWYEGHRDHVMRAPSFVAAGTSLKDVLALGARSELTPDTPDLVTTVRAIRDAVADGSAAAKDRAIAAVSRRSRAIVEHAIANEVIIENVRPTHTRVTDDHVVVSTDIVPVTIFTGR